MRKSKLLKCLLIPTLGVSTIGIVATISTSCGKQKLSEFVKVTAIENSTLQLEVIAEDKPDLQYSYDGNNWTAYNSLIKINAKQSLYLRGNNKDGWSKNYSAYAHFIITGSVSISGNVMSLLDNGIATTTTIPCKYCLINYSKIVMQ